jgi:flagellar hook assembly protein FlgD
MRQKLVQVVFLSKNSNWPNKWEDSEELKDHWAEFKDLVGNLLPGKVLLVNDKAVVGVNWYLKDDKSSKQIGLKWLRDNGYVAEFWDGKKEKDRVGPLES